MQNLFTQEQQILHDQADVLSKNGTLQYCTNMQGLCWHAQFRPVQRLNSSN